MTNIDINDFIDSIILRNLWGKNLVQDLWAASIWAYVSVPSRLREIVAKKQRTTRGCLFAGKSCRDSVRTHPKRIQEVPRKLTWQWKISIFKYCIFNRKYIFTCLFFPLSCYFLGGVVWISLCFHDFLGWQHQSESFKNQRNPARRHNLGTCYFPTVFFVWIYMVISMKLQFLRNHSSSQNNKSFSHTIFFFSSLLEARTYGNSIPRFFKRPFGKDTKISNF